MENQFNLEGVYVYKIENGYLVTRSGYIVVEVDKEKWKEIKYYCKDLKEVNKKLEELFKEG